MNTTETIGRTIEALAGEIEAKKSARDALALRLVDNPDDTALLEDLQSADAEVDLLAKRTALFEAARRASVSRDTEQAAASRVGLAVEARDRAVDAATSRVKVAKEIDTAVRTLGGLLSKWRAASDLCAEAAQAVLEAAHPGDVDAHLTRWLSFARYAGPQGLAAPLGGALVATGVSAAGDGAFDINLRFAVGPEETCEAIARTAANQVAAQLDGALRRLQA